MGKYQLYVLVGIPGSGKSTFAEKHLREKPIVSRDAIRFGLVEEGEDYFSKETEVFDMFIDSIVGACHSFDCAVVDATHVSKASRRKLFNALDRYIKGQYETNIIYFHVPLGTCLSRNKMRDGRALVPEQALQNMYRQLSEPEYDEHVSIKEIWKIEERLF